MFLPLVGFLLLLPTQAAAMPAPTPTAPIAIPTPTNAKERMELAEKVNGLHGMSTPWHLKASYELFDEDGKSTDKGTYEEWRVSEKRYRVAFHSASLSVEEFGTDHGVFRTGTQEWPRHPLSSITEMVSTPVSQPQSFEKTVLENFQKNSGDEKLPCTALRKPGFEQTPNNSRSFCFTPSNAVLLYSSSPNDGFKTVFEHVRLVQGQNIAFDMHQFVAGGPSLKVHVDLLENLDSASRSALTLPEHAVPVTRRLSSPGEIEPGRLRRKVAPAYPLLLKLKGVQGTVLVNAIIAKDGRVTGMRVLAGPPLLRQSALDAVGQWVYTPSTRDGEPVEVENDINVGFSVVLK